MFDRLKSVYRTSRRAAGETGDTAWTLALAALVGVGVGIAAVLLFIAVEFVGDLVENGADRSGVGDWIFLVSIPLGFVGAWWIASTFAPEVEGDGVPEAATGLALHGGYLSSRSVPSRFSPPR